MSAIAHLAVVASAGGLGCGLRVLVRDAVQRRGGRPWWAVCAINLVGALAMGAVMAGVPGPWATVASGALAGWTTYSAFAMDAVQLWLRGERLSAAALWAATLAGAPAAAFAGHAAARAAMGPSP